MANNFEEIKAELIERVKPKNPCAEQYRRALSSQTEEELLEVVKDNISWCSENGACPDSWLAKFTPSILLGAGIANSGEGNSGLANTGDRNTGHRNTGHWNTGDWNTGDRNTGHRNTGHWNTGDRNTGHSNTGDRNTGAFCTGSAPFPMFNKPSSWTERDFIDSKAFQLLCQVDTKQWIPTSHMTDEEKAKYPSHKTADGYLKDIPFKEAFQNSWHNWSAENRKAFTDLPNFDSDIFFEITGVRA